MLKVIAVDDEKKALDRVERILKEDKRVQVLGTFTTAKDALEFIVDKSVDIAFLDIEMPLMGGLELGRKLSKENPNIEVVFITAHDQYALDAFQVHAIGYLLKPLDKNEVKKQVDYIISKLNCGRNKVRSDVFMVKCFGQFICYPYGNEEDILRWRTSKTEELFALLMHYQGKPMSKDIIMDTLWPELKIKSAANNFRVTCTYLRNTFVQRGIKDILVRERDSYMINIERVCCDAFDFIRISNSHLSETVKNGDIQKLPGLYKGAYMENKVYDWSLGARAWFHKTFEKLQNNLAEVYLKEKRYKEACEAIESIIEREPLSEEAVKRLICIKYKMGDKVSGIGAYEKYKERLFKEMGIQPSFNVKALSCNKVLNN